MIDIVFLGTPDFAVPSLAALIENGYNVKAVFTQPDRPKGRGNKVSFSPVKEYALAHSIPVFQPQKIRLDPELLEELKPDLMVTAAFGQILSQRNLDAARLGCVNVHGSLLPAYRGSSPIQWAVINGEKVTGVTTMFTALGVDSGDILLQSRLDIGEDETAGELFDRLSLLGADTLIKTVKMIENGTAKRIPQNESLATHFPMLSKENAGIDFSQKAAKIKDLVRGLNPWPVAWCMAGEDVLKIYSVKVTEIRSTKPAGRVVYADNKHGLVVATGDFDISVGVLQFPGKKAMDARTYFVGNSLKTDFLTNGR